MSTRVSRRVTRSPRRPLLESLEARTLLTVGSQVADISTLVPLPSAASGAATASDADRIIGAGAARSEYGVDGSGLNVAVIDTGVNYRHEALGGGIGSGYRVVGGYDFAEKDDDPNADTWQHGTAVAGLIASDDPAHLGVAPGAGIVALRVFGDDNKGDFNRIADALQWVVDHHEEYRISAVNLSISDGNNYTKNWFADDLGIGRRMRTLIGTLRDLNIPVVTATGNSFQGEQGVGFTAIDAQTISVTSTDSSDKLVSDAQRLGAELGGAAATDLAAPGTDLSAPAEGDGFTSVSGTSFSTPLVTGSIVLLQQLYQSRFGKLPSASQLESWLKGGADTITDGVTGITIGRLNVAKSAGLVPKPAPQVIETPAGPGTGGAEAPPAEAPPAEVPPAEPPPSSPPVNEPPPAEAPPAQTPPEGSTATEIYINGKSAGTFGSDELAGQIQAIFPNFGGTLTDVHLWGEGDDAPAANPVLGLDQLQVWGQVEGNASLTGQAQAAGKMGKSSEAARPLVWKAATPRRRRRASFVRKDVRG